MWFTGNYRTEFQMTLKQAQSASHSGQCDSDVEYLVTGPLKRKLSKLDPKEIVKELKECGAWDEIELQDHEQNLRRLVWIAAGNIVEEQFNKGRD